MKKAIVFFLILTLIFSAVGCASQNNSSNAGGTKSESTIDKVLARKKLLIGTGPGYLPFDMKDKEGNFIGYDMDLGNAIGKALNVPVEYVQYDFPSLIPALQNGEIDMAISGMAIRGDRALAVSFSNSYYEAGQVVMVNINDNTTQSWKDLDVEGKTIAVSQGTSGALLAKQIFKKATVADYEGFVTACLGLTQGKADAVVYDGPAIKIYETMNPGKVRGIYDLICAENQGIAVAKNDLETVQWLNSFLEQYRNSPDEIASREKWFESKDWMDNIEE